MPLRMLPICRNGIVLVAILLTACSSFPEYSHPTYQTHYAAPADVAGKWADAFPLDDPQACRMAMLVSGTDAFSARLLLAAMAQQSLDLQYYLFHNDLTGKLFVWMLLQAADRGVRVRVLLDDMASVGADDYLRLINRHPNIEIRLFNPFEREYPREMQFITRYGVSTRRMHNKSMIADNTVAVVGGRNIGDEYFDAARNSVVFGDLDILTLGPVVDDVSTEFDRYWNSDVALPVEYVLKDNRHKDNNGLVALRLWLDSWIKSHQNHPYGRILRQNTDEKLQNYQQHLYTGRAYVVADAPAKIAQNDKKTLSPVLTNMVSLMDNATDEILLISPYFVPGEGGVEYLSSLVKKGVKVQVVTNSLATTDVPAVHSAYKQYRQALVKAGVILWELKPDAGARYKSHWLGSSSASLHAKVTVIDGHYFYIGSMNFDPRSAWQNTEMGMLVDQPEIGRTISDTLNSGLKFSAYRLTTEHDQLRWRSESEDGAEQNYHHDPRASLWRRVQSWLLGFLPIESEL